MSPKLGTEEFKEKTDSSNNKKAKKNTNTRKTKKSATNTKDVLTENLKEDILNTEDSLVNMNDDENIKIKNHRKRNSNRFTIIKGDKPGTDEIKIIQTFHEEEEVGKLEIPDNELTEDVSEKIAMFEEKSFLSNAGDYSNDNGHTRNLSKILDDSITGNDKEKNVIKESNNNTVLKSIKDYDNNNNSLNKNDDENANQKVIITRSKSKFSSLENIDIENSTLKPANKIQTKSRGRAKSHPESELENNIKEGAKSHFKTIEKEVNEDEEIATKAKTKTKVETQSKSKSHLKSEDLSQNEEIVEETKVTKKTQRRSKAKTQDEVQKKMKMKIKIKMKMKMKMKLN
ncbi:hypothetical protein LY90DRAFT_510540 [Neocallimastix californiae]|uniref:Uncharacterized protein n=1 Tax=Neocallimastix californiae TaxID=1754190 RepID=A0A1Y2BY96_9FUNG|nr:hypothetical protein LY90DRAFT_510540 [Neocallimastix californiae]|eukprot:ORY39752.1 hypothetical protein LY90DRAFT_510540 [Neocallimastix californiae]